MKTVLYSEVNSFSTWLSFSEISAMLGERFAVSLRDSYPRLYKLRWDHDPKPDLSDDPSYELDLVFQFINELFDKQK